MSAADTPPGAMDIDPNVVQTVLAGSWRRGSHLHGEEHWWCVAATGLDLADAHPGVDRAVVVLFGLLHDTRRENDSYDPEHGPRAAAWTRELAHRGSLLLDPGRLALLAHAVELHTAGQVTDDPTVGACWDADRLHLPRVGITPSAELLSTAPARGAAQGALATTCRGAVGDWDSLLARL